MKSRTLVTQRLYASLPEQRLQLRLVFCRCRSRGKKIYTTKKKKQKRRTKTQVVQQQEKKNGKENNALTAHQPAKTASSQPSQAKPSTAKPSQAKLYQVSRCTCVPIHLATFRNALADAARTAQPLPAAARPAACSRPLAGPRPPHPLAYPRTARTARVGASLLHAFQRLASVLAAAVFACVACRDVWT